MAQENGAGLGKIERRRAVDDVYDRIRAAILNRAFAPGARLNVDELASQLGVSLTPVRSAIQLLAAEGLVDVQSRSGTYVATWTRRDLDETFDLRCALECLAAEKGAANLTDDQIARARLLIVSLGRPVRSEAQRRMHEEANTELHNMLIEAAGNHRLADMYHGLQAHIAMSRIHGAENNWQSRLPQEQEEHEHIVSAMEKRDAAALSRALRKHILRAKEAMIASLPEEKA